MAIHIEGGPNGSPYSSDLLADLHAGIVPTVLAKELWPTVLKDRAAVEFLDALDDTSALLQSLDTIEPEQDSAPAEVLTRITSALPSNVLTFPPPKDRAARNKLQTLGIAVGSIAACTALILGITTVVGYNTDKESSDSAVAATPPKNTPGPSTAPSSANSQTSFLAYLGKNELGPLSEPTALKQCLVAHGLNTTPLLGSGTLEFNNQSAVLLLIPGPNPATITALVVGTGCNSTNPALISRTNIGMS
ncbi:MAG: hypothetical protein ACRCSF_02700 [Mycobacteriaceae bacterium]